MKMRQSDTIGRFAECCVVALMVLLVEGAAAEPAKPDRLSGEIEIEDTQARAVGPRKSSIDGATKFIGDLTNAMKSGGGVPAPDDLTLTYFNVLYLYCLHKRGECGFVLDTILESDVIASRATKKSECPTMSRYWKLWLRDEMEKRGKYLVTLGNAPKVARFNSQERPKYIKCKEAVASAIAENFTHRYSADGEAQRALKTVSDLMAEIEARDIDMFTVVGYKFSSSKELE